VERFYKAVKDLTLARQTINDIYIKQIRKKEEIENSNKRDFKSGLNCDLKVGEYRNEIDRDIELIVKKADLYIMTRDNELNCTPEDDCSTEHGTCLNYKPFKKNKCLAKKLDIDELE